MRRSLPVVALLLTLHPASTLLASGLEDALEGRWLGAWVVTGVEAYSDCAGTYTNNRVNGRLVSGRGRTRLKGGELAKINKVDLKRSRIDLLLALSEPVLLSYTDGPFTLYNETSCRVEIQIEVPRQMVSDDDVRGIESRLLSVVSPFATEAEARASRAYNRRQRQDYPPDYERTLAEHAVWKAEQANAMVQARFDNALSKITALHSSIASDAEYLEGFARGVEAARGVRVNGCGELTAFNLDAPYRNPKTAAYVKQGEAKTRSDLGFEDGRKLVLGLELMRRLPGCYVTVPEPPAPPTANR